MVRNAPVNQVHMVGADFHLLMPVTVETDNGLRKVCNILVDTGAEANLIRKDFWPEEYFQEARRKLRFVVADGSVMQGGRRTMRMHMAFKQTMRGQEYAEPLWLTGEFYEAPIGVDAILSYPWLREHEISVFPHYNAIAKDKPELVLLRGYAQGRSQVRNVRGQKKGRTDVGEIVG